MFIGKVIGTVWATKKYEQLEGLKFLIVKPYRLNMEIYDNNEAVVVADILGAGVGEDVIIAYGKAARVGINAPNMPIEASVVGIIDHWEINGEINH